YAIANGHRPKARSTSPTATRAMGTTVPSMIFTSGGTRYTTTAPSSSMLNPFPASGPGSRGGSLPAIPATAGHRALDCKGDLPGQLLWSVAPVGLSGGGDAGSLGDKGEPRVARWG